MILGFAILAALGAVICLQGVILTVGAMPRREVRRLRLRIAYLDAAVARYADEILEPFEAELEVDPVLTYLADKLEGRDYR